MLFSKRFLLAAAGASLALAVSGCNFNDDDPPAPSYTEGFVTAEGANLHLVRARADGLVDVSSTSLPAGLDANHTIFSVTRHPTQPWLYVTSFLNYDWGNARIDRFVIHDERLVHAGRVFKYDDQSLATSNGQPTACAGTDDGSGNYGSCAPVAGSFSADGRRFYVQEDSDDVLQIFEVNLATGGLTLIWEGENPSLHGIARHPVQNYLYNGSTVFDVTGDVASSIFSGADGNDTTIVNTAAGELLVSTVGTGGVGVYSLANPAQPALVDEVTLSQYQLRAVAVNSNATRLITAGRNNVRSFSFDGSSLTGLDTLDKSGGSFTYENRKLALTGDGKFALVAWFKSNVTSGRPDGGLPEGGFTLYGIADDGTLSELEEVTTAARARVVERIRF